MKTAITELLNIEYPIVQGAMAWVADADLASAVSNAGGLGVIGTGHDNVDTVRAKVEAMFAKTDKPFAVNVMLLNPHVEEVVDYLIASGVKIITSFFYYQFIDRTASFSCIKACFTTLREQAKFMHI